MSITTTSAITVDDVLKTWEKHYGNLNKSNRESFKAHRDAKALTQYSIHQIERAIRLRKARYLPDILQFLKKWEYSVGRATSPVTQPALTTSTLRVTEYESKYKSSSYACGVCSALVAGVSCLCRLAY
jgi:hypothetical protein